MFRRCRQAPSLLPLVPRRILSRCAAGRGLWPADTGAARSRRPPRDPADGPPTPCTPRTHAAAEQMISSDKQHTGCGNSMRQAACSQTLTLAVCIKLRADASDSSQPSPAAVRVDAWTTRPTQGKQRSTRKEVTGVWSRLAVTLGECPSGVQKIDHCWSSATPAAQAPGQLADLQDLSELQSSFSLGIGGRHWQLRQHQDQCCKISKCRAVLDIMLVCLLLVKRHDRSKGRLGALGRWFALSCSRLEAFVLANCRSPLTAMWMRR